MSIYSRKPALRNRQGQGQDIGQGYMISSNPRTGQVSYAGQQGSLLPQKGTKLVGANGEYNANDNKQLMEIARSMMHLAQSGDVRLQRATFGNMREHEGMFRAAMTDPNWKDPNSSFMKLGEVFGDAISETMGRMGWTNKILQQQDIPEQGTARIRVRQKDVNAWLMTGDGFTVESQIRQKYIYPQGYDLTAHVTFYEAELHEAGSQLLEEKYNDALEATMVRDDNITKFLLDQAAGTVNDLIGFNAFTPAVFAALHNQIVRWSLPVPHAIIAVDIWQDLFADSDWQRWYSPIEKHEWYVEGRLGRLADVELITDAFVYDTLQVLLPGEVYFLSSPQTLGEKTNFIPMKSTLIDKAVIGRPVRGWYLYSRQATTIVNSRGVSKGFRL
jgi:hypothetical protein